MSELGVGEYFSIGYCFAGEEEKIPLILDSYEQCHTDLSNVNRVLELYNARLFFEKYEFVTGWDDGKYERYKALSMSADSVVKDFFLALSIENIVSIYDSCDVIFWDDFWLFFYRFGVYKRIPKARFIEITDGLRMSPNKMLENKAFVKYFDSEITDRLYDPEFGADFFIDYYLSQRCAKERYFLPQSLNPERIYKTVEKFITEVEFVNANKLALIFSSKSIDTKMFNVDDKLRYKARKRYDRIWEEKEQSGQVILKKGYGVNIQYSPECLESKVEFKDGYIKAEYSTLWIKENLDYPTLLNNFIYVFNYFDSPQMRCMLTNACFAKGTFEDLFSINGNGMYRKGESFNLVNMLASAQIQSYMEGLKGLDVYLEEICKWFFEEYLKDEFNVGGFICSFPKRDADFLDKCKLLSSAMDGAIKQYKLFADEGEIDRGLYEMSSTPVAYRDLPSFSKYKYAYIANSDITKEMNMLFSDQSHLAYIDKTKSKYSVLVQLINSIECSIDDFYEYQVADIQWLIEKGSLFVENDTLHLNINRVAILKQFYDFGYICLPHFKNNYLKQMIRNGDIRTESSLLSIPEYQYIDYILNKREFSNGLDLRNKYIHDSNTTDERVQKQDYSVLMKVMIILIIKINDEFCIRASVTDGEEDFYEL